MVKRRFLFSNASTGNMLPASYGLSTPGLDGQLANKLFQSLHQDGQLMNTRLCQPLPQDGQLASNLSQSAP
jgi:hypothetical protein